ncbi:TetR/AcrR family transcriptional regulator [bacterium]|nr:TetR/AcrR family transcriptional regulator [bacterium]
MSSTKQKILAASQQLFNDCGVSNVSLRTIADEVGISVGNLQYHFKKREDVIETLYFQLVEKIDEIYSIRTDDLMESFFNISIEMFELLYEYHFFLLDFILIIRNNKKIKNHYSELSRRREEEFTEFVGVFIKNGLFREEVLVNEYQSFFKRTEVITNFWFSSVLIQTEKLSKETIGEYSLLIGQSIYPYLTVNGRNKYASMFPSQLI